MAVFDAWAEYYDLLQKGVEGDVEFYVGQALRTGGRTLEIGCGTGRIALVMAMSGVDVTGLDNSAKMLARCRAKKRAIGKSRGRLKLVKADMTDFNLGGTFDFVAMPYRTFMHLLTPWEQRQCLDCVRAHLAEDGLFVLNTWAARPSAIAPFLGAQSGVLHLVGREAAVREGRSILHYCASTYDEWTQLLREEHIIQELDSEGVLVRTSTLPMTRAWTTPREMEALVSLSGFEVEALLGDFSGTPFNRQSTETIWILRKA